MKHLKHLVEPDWTCKSIDEESAKLHFDPNIILITGNESSCMQRAHPPIHTVVFHSTDQSVILGHVMTEALQVIVSVVKSKGCTVSVLYRPIDVVQLVSMGILRRAASS